VMLKDFGCATGLHLEKQTDFHFVRGLLTVMRWVILMGWRLGYYSPPPQQPNTCAPVSMQHTALGRAVGFLGGLGLGCKGL